ncbi:MAG: 4'-phosphopantetheinyl transferase superfamily protein [Candidatus Adiutrix sp.]|nr:4'-phosphopantetheinyl transferase superfamily protein [Candidatus Adiutrix sp.]
MNIRHFINNSDLTLTLLLDDPALPVGVYESRLGPKETARGREKRSSAAYRAWLLGRWAAKAAAVEFWKPAGGDPEIFNGPEGEPLLVWPGRPDFSGCLSISHCPGAALAAVSGRPLGVDLERRDRALGERVRRWAFNGRELTLIDQGAGSRFSPALALWCGREAAAKSWGRALLKHLDKVRVTRADWRSGLLWVDWLAEPRRQSRVALFNRAEHLLALAGSFQQEPGPE